MISDDNLQPFSDIHHIFLPRLASVHLMNFWIQVHV